MRNIPFLISLAAIPALLLLARIEPADLRQFVKEARAALRARLVDAPAGRARESLSFAPGPPEFTRLHR